MIWWEFRWIRSVIWYICHDAFVLENFSFCVSSCYGVTLHFFKVIVPKVLCCHVIKSIRCWVGQIQTELSKKRHFITNFSSGVNGTYKFITVGSDYMKSLYHVMIVMYMLIFLLLCRWISLCVRCLDWQLQSGFVYISHLSSPHLRSDMPSLLSSELHSSCSALAGKTCPVFMAFKLVSP